MFDQIAELDPAGKLIVGLFVAAILGLFAWIFFRVTRTEREYLCKSCGTVGKAAKVTPGSFILEIGLWVAFIVPGILYSVYRVSKRHNACANCKSTDIIPKESPVAERFMAQQGSLTK